MQPASSKIVVTLGPATQDPETIRSLVESGADVFRLNFSHGTREQHASFIAAVRKAAAEAGRPAAVLQDLQGPRIRTGPLMNGRDVMLRQGETVHLIPGDFPGDETRIAVSYDRFTADVSPGDHVLINDGMIDLVVRSCEEMEAICVVVTGGVLGERKGINLPDSPLTVSAPTEKDIADLRFGLEHGVDFVALSFVARKEDVRNLRTAMVQTGAPPVPIIAKIERPHALERLDDILDEADGVMVARGDLGIEVPVESVPVAQKKIIRAANSRGMPVITATQMLESMVQSPLPTRAEATDVANAVLDGSDAVMLSAETSVGRYPAGAVRMMKRIVQHVEGHYHHISRPSAYDWQRIGTPAQSALARAACTVAEEVEAQGIAAFTLSGSTARCLSCQRPAAPVYALTPDEAVCRRLCLLWGVHPVKVDVYYSTDEMIAHAAERLKKSGLAVSGDTFIYIAGSTLNAPGGADMLKIQRFE